MSKPIALLVVLMMAAPAIGGTMFRLEIGPPIAAGTGAPNAPQLKKKLAFVVRPRVCDKAGSVHITGTAEGLVNGTRQSVELSLFPVNTAEGVYGVLQQWPENGRWVVQLNGTCPSPKASATTLVPMNGSTFIRDKTQVLREPATRQQLEALLKELS